MVSAFEGNKAETKTMVPVIEKFMAARNYPDVTVIADAGMIAEANQKAIEAGRQTITATTSAEPSKPSPTATEVRTSLSQLRFPA